MVLLPTAHIIDISYKLKKGDRIIVGSYPPPGSELVAWIFTNPDKCIYPKVWVSYPSMIYGFRVKKLKHGRTKKKR